MYFNTLEIYLKNGERNSIVIKEKGKRNFELFHPSNLFKKVRKKRNNNLIKGKKGIFDFTCRISSMVHRTLQFHRRWGNLSTSPDSHLSARRRICLLMWLKWTNKNWACDSSSASRSSSRDLWVITSRNNVNTRWPTLYAREPIIHNDNYETNL